MQALKNNVAISISHIHSYIKKIIHHAINISSTKTELFTIRCKINQAIQIPEVSHIIIITNTIHSAKRIFNLSVLLQLQDLKVDQIKNPILGLT